MAEAATLTRPMPPALLSDVSAPRYLVDGYIGAPDVRDWALDAFVAQDAPLHDVELQHLAAARIGVLWTNVDNRRGNRLILGRASMPGRALQGVGVWDKGIYSHALWMLTGETDLDFLLILNAPWCAQANDRAFCALVYHELLHFDQRRDEFGFRRFTREGDPIFSIRPHDVEEFDAVVAAFGPEAIDESPERFSDAVWRGHKPRFDDAAIARACGGRQ